jgi:hypothetical protein
MSNYRLAKASVPRNVGDYIFSVHVDFIDTDLAIGLADFFAPLEEKLGFNNNSIGYFSNGSIQYGGVLLTSSVPTYGLDDTIHVRVAFSRQEVNFYKNEDLVYTAHGISISNVYPSVCVNGPGDVLTANFGQDEMFLPAGASSWDRRRSALPPTTFSNAKLSSSSNIKANAKSTQKARSSIGPNSGLTANSKFFKLGSIHPTSIGTLGFSPVAKKRGVSAFTSLSGLGVTGTKFAASGQSDDGFSTLNPFSNISTATKKTTKTTGVLNTSSSIITPARKVAKATNSLTATSLISASSIVVPNPITNLGASLGGWWDVSDLSTMFQDTAGTVAAVVNSAVARINDKSAVVAHLTQATLDARPILRTDGTYYWLEFDGSNDYIEGPSAAFSISSLIAAYRKTNSGNYHGLFTNKLDQTTNVDFALTTMQSGTAFDLTQNAGSSLADSAHCWVNRVQTDAFSLNVNLVISIDGTGFPATRQFPHGIYIGQDRNNPGRYFQGRWYGAIVANTILTATQRNSTEDYVAGKCGVALP